MLDHVLAYYHVASDAQAMVNDGWVRLILAVIDHLEGMQGSKLTLNSVLLHLLLAHLSRRLISELIV